MGAMGILDRQIMQVEPRLDGAQHLLAGLQQPDPDEAAGLIGRFRRLDTDGLIAMPLDIKGAVNHHCHDLITPLALSPWDGTSDHKCVCERLSSGAGLPLRHMPPMRSVDTVLQADEGCDCDFLRPEIGEVVPVNRRGGVP
jgi:hypothetical protein